MVESCFCISNMLHAHPNGGFVKSGCPHIVLFFGTSIVNRKTSSYLLGIYWGTSIFRHPHDHTGLLFPRDGALHELPWMLIRLIVHHVDHAYYLLDPVIPSVEHFKGWNGKQHFQQICDDSMVVTWDCHWENPPCCGWKKSCTSW